MSRATVSPGTCGDVLSVPTTTPRSGFPPRDFVPRSLHNGNPLLSHIVTSCCEMPGYGAKHDLAMTNRPGRVYGPAARPATRMVNGSPPGQFCPGHADASLGIAFRRPCSCGLRPPPRTALADIPHHLSLRTGDLDQDWCSAGPTWGARKRQSSMRSSSATLMSTTTSPFLCRSRAVGVNPRKKRRATVLSA